MPPPPVPGGSVGNVRFGGPFEWPFEWVFERVFGRLFEGLGDGDGLGLGLGLGAMTPGTLGLGVGVRGARVLGVRVPGVGVRGARVRGAVLLGAAPGVVAPAVLGEVALGVWPDGVALGVPVAELAGVADPLPPGENDGGVVDGEPDEQADTDAGTRSAMTAAPSTVPRRRLRP